MSSPSLVGDALAQAEYADSLAWMSSPAAAAATQPDPWATTSRVMSWAAPPPGSSSPPSTHTEAGSTEAAPGLDLRGRPGLPNAVVGRWSLDEERRHRCAARPRACAVAAV